MHLRRNCADISFGLYLDLIIVSSLSKMYAIGITFRTARRVKEAMIGARQSAPNNLVSHLNMLSKLVEASGSSDLVARGRVSLYDILNNKHDWAVASAANCCVRDSPACPMSSKHVALIHSLPKLTLPILTRDAVRIEAWTAQLGQCWWSQWRTGVIGTPNSVK